MFSANDVFPIAGRPGDDDQIAVWKPGGHLVEVVKPRGHAGDVRLALDSSWICSNVGLSRSLDRHEALPHALVGDLEDALLGAVEDSLGLVAAGVGLALRSPSRP